MQTDVNVNENVKALFEKLESFLKSRTVVGEQLQVGDVTLIPFVNVTFGLGGGVGDSNDGKGNKGVGSGMGVGAKVTPTAILVIRGEKTELIPISKMAGLEKLVDMVPDIVNKIKKEKGDDAAKGEKQDGGEA